MSSVLSPLAPKTLATLPPLDGVRLSSAPAGIKYTGRDDVMLMVFDTPATVAGVFTRSRCPSAPVEWCRAGLAGQIARALVVNSGNANAFTGRKGDAAARETANAAAETVGCAPSEVFLASTGVIGEPLDAGKITSVLGRTVDAARPDRWIEAARSIMTTDTFPKVATRTVRIGATDVTVNGMAKGAGMIAPDMATMLSFIATDAAVDPDLLQDILAAGVGPTFNSVTVDSDTSTSDTVLVFATGAAEARGQSRIRRDDGDRLADFAGAVHAVMHDLALQVVRDGEGARKLVKVTVTGAASAESAGRIARSIANSPLVKTAVAGEDANWGRVVMAVGKAGEPAERDRLQIWFGDVRVAAEGERDPGYSEAAASAVMKHDEIAIRVDLGLAEGTATVWTCDLTKDYVAINGDYRS